MSKKTKRHRRRRRIRMVVMAAACPAVTAFLELAREVLNLLARH